MSTKKWVYGFTQVNQAENDVGGDWQAVRAFLGGKGANLADMTRAGVPVPPVSPSPLKPAMPIWLKETSSHTGCGIKNWQRLRKWRPRRAKSLAMPKIHCWYLAALAQNSLCRA